MRLFLQILNPRLSELVDQNNFPVVFFALKWLLACFLFPGLIACNDVNNDKEQLNIPFKTMDQHNKNTSNKNIVSQHSLIVEKQLKRFAKNLKLKYTIINNVDAKQCKKLVKNGLCFDASISLSSQRDLKLKNWRIYFSQMLPILDDYSDYFDIGRINGDLHYIQPTEKFKSFAQGVVYSIPFKAKFWQISEFDSPPNFYVVVDGHSPVIVDSTRSAKDPQTKLEFLPHMTEITQSKQFKRNRDDRSVWATAENLFTGNQRFSNALVDSTTRIIPKPYQLLQPNPHKLIDIQAGIRIVHNSFGIDQNDPAVQRMERLGIKYDSKKGIPINFIHTKSSQQLEEGYQLDIQDNKMTITATTKAGADYALQSISGLYKPGDKNLPQLKIIDKPRYLYRGLFIDVARNFRSKAFIIKMLDQMAAYKLNKFHFHLGDDEGWRLEIPGLPELTQLGARRCHDLKETKCLLPMLGNGPSVENINNGFYSLDDYREILLAAKARNIEVIPSFDMPGHSRAAIKSMQLRYKKLMMKGDKELAEEYLLSDPDDQSQYSSVQHYDDNTLNVCRKSTYHFIEKILSEVISVHRSVGIPLKTYHIGSDETAGAWKNSPICKNFIKHNKISVEQLSHYFIKRVALFLDSKKIIVAGWSDGLSKLSAQEMPNNVQVNAWTPLFWNGHKIAHSMVNRNWKVVLSLPDMSYFDFPYQADPKERGYYWGARFTNTRKVFEWMPGNLPAHAEIWNDRLNNPMILDDRPQKVGTSEEYQPMKSGHGFFGLQAQLWGETVRSDEIAEYMLFPRLLGIAERAWSWPQWEPKYQHDGAIYSRQTHYFTKQNIVARQQDWTEFSSAIGLKELPKLEIEKIKFRLPTPGAIYQNKTLKMNSPFPGLKLEYQVGDSEWLTYHDNKTGVILDTQQKIKVRTRSYFGHRVGRSLTLNSNLQ